MPDPLGELRARVQALEKENARLRVMANRLEWDDTTPPILNAPVHRYAGSPDIAELHRRIVQPIIEAESRAIVEYERRDRGDEEPYGLSVMELEARYLEARKRLWRADMNAQPGDEDEPARCIHCKRPMDPERDGPKLAPVCADCRPKHTRERMTEELRGESPITTALRHAQEAVRLLEELPAVRAAWDAQDEILDPRRRMWEAHQAQKNVRDAAQGRP